MITVATESELIEAVRDLDASSEPVLVLGGGSNVLVGDGGFEGTVLKIYPWHYGGDRGMLGAVITVQPANHGTPWCDTPSSAAGAA